MIIKDLGAVSAYAYAVEKGYTGTEEEFAVLMASYATVAEEAAESAESASQSAESASASAQTATTKASEASTSATQAGASATSASQSAQTATTKASEASASASTASTKASEASASASTASSKASEASQSASDASTAKTAAESSATTAQTAAQTATAKAAEAAESARTLTIDTTLTQSGQAADSKVVGDEIEGVKSELNDIEDKFQAVSTEIDLNNYTAVQTVISPNNGMWSGMASNRSWFIPVDGVDEIAVTADDSKNAYVALLKTNAHVPNTYPDYATGSTRTVIEPGESLTLKVPDDANYIYVVKQSSAGSPIPKSIIFKTYSDVPLVDGTLTVDGGAADAKVTGDKINDLTGTIGAVVTAGFTKPASGNAVANFARPVQAGKAIKFVWTGEEVTSDSSLNLYSRATASGTNVETLKLNARANTIYEVTPTIDASYLRVVATRTGTITIYDGGTLIDDVRGLKSDVAQLESDMSDLPTTTPFVRFGFSHDMYDPSDIFGEGGEIGSIAGWESKAEALTKVHAAFDALCSSGGAGYGYGERITGLYKESSGDESLLDILAPSYVTNGVTQGETVTLPIGTDTSDNPVTYSYTYESNTDPYEVRLYKFQDTNNALHTSNVDIPKKKILLVGGTHGNEFCAPINLYVLAKHLCSDYSNPDVLKLRSAFDVYIVPYLNGFGCQYQWNNGSVLTTGARCNGRMVDINRNCYTAGWAGATGTAEQITASFESNIANLATNTFPGSGNGSEFESQLVKGLIELIQPDVFIDHHHNSGNTPFYTTCRGSYAGNLIYQAANDSAYARLHNMPQYFGTKYNLFLGSDVSPATKAAANGHMQTMAYELGVKMNAVSEMPESIAYLNGVVDSATKAATKYSALAFKQAEYTLLNVALHMCQWAMEHNTED